jgi:uncharacterized phiE125 gp8 family phage protein
MTLIKITEPTVEPLTAAEVRDHLHIDDSVADEDFAGWIAAARQEAEHLTGRALITQTWERVLHAFPVGRIPLGMPPVVSITSVKYIDTAGVEQTLSASAYTLDEVSDPGWLYPSVAYPTWPSTQADRPNAVRVRFTCGYGAASSAVPAPIRHWMKLRIGTMEKLRDGVVIGVSATEVSNQYIDRLLDRYRIWTV